MTVKSFTIKTRSNFEMQDITPQIREIINQSNVNEGTALIFIPHTTAGVTINENADPDVMHDMVKAFNMVSPDRSDYRHAEGNSRAHLLSSLVGPDLNLIIDNSRPVLGTWQDVYFCEFDGPRTRKVYVKIVNG